MKRTIRESIWILVIAGGLAAAAGLFHPLAPSWYLVQESGRWELRVETFREVLGSDAERVIWVDSRTDAHFAKDHLEGAILLNRERWLELIAENQDRLQEAFDRPVIVYCDGRGCQRSKEIAEWLRQRIGLEPVYVLRGDWRKIR